MFVPWEWITFDHLIVLILAQNHGGDLQTRICLSVLRMNEMGTAPEG